MSLITRRRAEIDARLQSLQVEFQHWKKVTTAEGGLGRHHTQVRRLTATIDGGLDALRAKIAQLRPDDASVLEQGEAWENEILAAHSIWEVFRSKLILRREPLFAKKLAVCDDLAWECYRPFQEKWAPDLKGPPLVYLSATWSPFVMSRDSNFQNEIRAWTGTTSALNDRFQKVLKHLPVPLVSLPWYQLYHLPGALIIAHEIGHVVEFDFDLTSEIDTALKQAKLEHFDIWRLWAREMFADVFGCCALGPFFAGAMADLNSTSVKRVGAEANTAGSYPTRNLRVRLLAETLVQTDHQAAAAELLHNWEVVYGENKKLEALQNELPQVVKALLAGPYRDLPLTDFLAFSAADRDAVATIGSSIEQGVKPEAHAEVRQLFASVQWLHSQSDDAQKFARAQEVLVDHIVGRSTSAVRGGVGGSDEGVTAQVRHFEFGHGAAQEDAVLKKQEAADRVRGQQLWAELLKESEE